MSLKVKANLQSVQQKTRLCVPSCVICLLDKVSFLFFYVIYHNKFAIS